MSTSEAMELIEQAKVRDLTEDEAIAVCAAAEAELALPFDGDVAQHPIVRMWASFTIGVRSMSATSFRDGKPDPHFNHNARLFVRHGLTWSVACVYNPSLSKRGPGT